MAKAYPQPKQGQSRAREEGGLAAPAGLWRHPESGEEAITQEDPLFGNAQSQGFLRFGFEYIRPAEPGEIKTLPELQSEARSAEANTVKGLSARLDQLEQATVDNEKLVAEVRDLRKKLAAAQEVEHKAKVEAAKKSKKQAAADKVQVEGAGVAATHGAALESGEHAKDNAEQTTDAREQEK